MELIKTALIGFGRMGEFYTRVIRSGNDLEIKYICDTDASSREAASQVAPEAEILSAPDRIFSDPEVKLVILSALADSRKEQVQKCFEAGKHVIAEKPIGVDREQEAFLAALSEKVPVFSTVDLYLRNSWYHNAMKSFIDSGEIGDLAIIRICHMTPGLVPGEGHEYEGPCFHDCGMHYVDIARWYAGAEFKSWHAQGMRMWDYKDPWWLQCHGTFDNGIVFDITQGFVYGQLSKDQTHNSYVDLIGTKGVARMTHDFKTAHVELRGVTRTEILDKPFGGKNLDVLCSKMAESIRTGFMDPSLPTFHDAAVASDFAWTCLEDAAAHELPSRGDGTILDDIRKRRSAMKDGYGLIKKRNS